MTTCFAHILSPLSLKKALARTYAVHLLSKLRPRGFGAAGTVRTTKPKREIIEEKDEETEPQKEHNRGLDPTLSKLKMKFNAQLN